MARFSLAIIFSAVVLSAQTTTYVVEGDAAQIRAAVERAGGVVLSHPDLLPNHTLARLDERQRTAMPGRIYRASQDLIEGRRVIGCPMAAPLNGPAAIISTYGDGWDGPGAGSVSLRYVFGNTATYGGMSPQQVQAEVVGALAKWAAVAAIDFTPGTDPLADWTLHIYWATGEHGDGYPFDPGGALAHAFYPPTYYERTYGYSVPIWGDVHFNGNYTWQVDWAYSSTLFSVRHVALHESGHALGLSHSEDPGAVMYAYYSTYKPVPMDLQPSDIESIRSIYEPRYSAPPPPPPPPAGRDARTGGALAVTIDPPPGSVDTATMALSGSLMGGVLPITLAWATDRGYSGTAAVNVLYTSGGPYVSWTATVPLDSGANAITLTGRDANGAVGTANVLVSRTGSGRAGR